MNPTFYLYKESIQFTLVPGVHAVKEREESEIDLVVCSYHHTCKRDGRDCLHTKHKRGELGEGDYCLFCGRK